MELTKKQRKELKNKYGGHCAYCGCELGKRWHADHLKPIIRVKRHKRDENNRPVIENGKHVYYTEVMKPELDVFENLMPACIKCNNDKSDFELDEWRKYIKHRLNTLNDNPKYASYQKAKKWGLVIEVDIDIIFYFEKIESLDNQNSITK